MLQITRAIIFTQRFRKDCNSMVTFRLLDSPEDVSIAECTAKVDAKRLVLFLRSLFITLYTP